MSTINREYGEPTIPHKNNYCGGNFDDWLEVLLTKECNGKCSWCVEKRGYHPDIVNYKKIANRIFSTNKKNVILLGGEPFLYDELKKLIKILINNNINVYITTNGSKLSDDSTKNLRGISGINISIHHYDINTSNKITGLSLKNEDIIKSIKNLHKNGTKIRLNCNCIKHHIDSYEEIKKYIEYAKYVNADSVRFAELKFDENQFVDLAKICNYEYCLNDNPFIYGCNTNTIIDGMSVNFRQMCGLQTNLRPLIYNPVSNTKKKVLYYNGILYNGWQIKEEVYMNKKRLKHVLEDVASGKIKPSEAVKLIDKDESGNHSSGHGYCQY